MTKTTNITTISEDNLHRIVGGFGAGPNQDTNFDVLGGVVADYQSSSRSDQAYRVDAIRNACRQTNTTTERTWYGGTRQVVNEPAAAQCVLNALDPTRQQTPVPATKAP